MGGIREGAEGETCGVGEGDFSKQAVAHLVCTEEDEAGTQGIRGDEETDAQAAETREARRTETIGPRAVEPVIRLKAEYRFSAEREEAKWDPSGEGVCRECLQPPLRNG